MCKEGKTRRICRQILSVTLTFVMALTLAPTYAVQATSDDINVTIAESGANLERANTSRNLAVGEDGSIHVVWKHSDGTIKYSKSTDGGEHFSDAVNVASGSECEVAVSSSGRVFVSYVSGNTSYIAYSDNGTTFTHVDLQKSGQSWHMATDGNYVYAIECNGEKLAYSSDNGASYQFQTGWDRFAYSDVLVDKSNHNVIVLKDDPNVVCRVSSDYGATFTVETPVNESSNQIKVYYSTATIGTGYAYMAGHSNSGEQQYCYKIDYTNSTATKAAIEDTSNRSLSADEAGNVIVGVEANDKVYYQLSTDGGVTFGEKVEVAPASSCNAAINPKTGDVLFLYCESGALKLTGKKGVVAVTPPVEPYTPVAGDNWAVNEDGTLGLADTAIDNAVGNMTKGKMVLIGTKGGTISNLPTGTDITVKASGENDAVLIRYDGEQEISVIKDMLKTIKFSDTTYQAHIDVTNGEDNLNVSTTDNTFGILNANDENGEAHAYKYINFTNEQAKNWISAYHHAITSGENLAGLKGYLATVTSSKEATLLNAFYKVVNPGNTNGGWIAATSLRYSRDKNASYNDVKDNLVTPDNYENIESPVGDSYKIMGTNGAYYWTTENISSRYCDYYYWACGPEQGQVVTKELWKSGEPNNSSNKESCTVASYSNTEFFNDFPVNNASVPGYFLEFSAYEKGLTADGQCQSTTIYRIIYDGNGATSGNVPAFQSKNKDVDLTLSENTGNLKKDGYQLVGWNTKADGTGTSYQLGGTYNVNAGGRLYAKWELKPEADINEPEPVKGLVATEGNETPILLVEKGGTEEGTIKYAIGTDPNIPPTGGWSEKVPTATKPGVYYVWSYVEGDEDHNDSTPTCVTVEIFKKKETKDDKKETAEITNDEGDVIETVEQTIIDETEKSVKIVKKDNPDTDMTVKVKITQPSEDTTNDGGIKLSDVSGGTLEYSMDGGKTWVSVPASNEITPIGKGEVLVRFKGTDTSEPSSPISVNVTVKDKEPEDTTYADKLDRTVAEFEKLVNYLTDLTDEQKKQYIDQIDAAYTTGKNEIASGKSDEEKAAAYNKAIEAMKSVFSDALKKDIETRADNAKKAIDNTAGLTSTQKADLKAEIDKAATTAIAAIKSAVDTMATNGAKENSGTAHPLKVDSDLVNGILDGLDKDIDAVKTKAKTLSSNGGKVSAKEAKANSMTLNAKLKVDQKGNAISVTWGKVKNADGYNVYVQYCGKKFTKPSKVITSKKICSVKIKKINGKRLNRKKNFKVCVKAYKKVAGKNVEIGKSITAHVVGVMNKEYTNVKDIKITSHTIIDVYTSSPYQITAKTILVDKSKKQLSDEHAKEFRYASSNESVAKVSDTGVIKGVKPGKCTIYVYARNGYAKTVKVTVKK